jgi:hypothetical protein
MSNTDLQQYNGTPYFPTTPNVGTNADPYLIPTDGPVICADSNNPDEAPVNSALKTEKDLYLGLRGAVVGDFAGAIRKTLKSLEVDGNGGVTSSLTPGMIQAELDIVSTAGNVITSAGDLLAPLGSCTVGQNVTATMGVFSISGLVSSGPILGQHTVLGLSMLTWFNTGTGSTDANPPQGTSIKNELRAINTPKCKTFIEMQAPNVINSFDGCGIQSVVINSGNPRLIEITFKDAFDNLHFTVKSTGVRAGPAANYMVPMERTDLRTVSKCFMEVLNYNSGSSIDFSTTALNFSVEIDGQQTT